MNVITQLNDVLAGGHPISHEGVAQSLRGLQYSLQGNRKTEEGAAHPDRDAQFRFINDEVRKMLPWDPANASYRL